MLFHFQVRRNTTGPSCSSQTRHLPTRRTKLPLPTCRANRTSTLLLQHNDPIFLYEHTSYHISISSWVRRIHLPQGTKDNNLRLLCLFRRPIRHLPHRRCNPSRGVWPNRRSIPFHHHQRSLLPKRRLSTRKGLHLSANQGLQLRIPSIPRCLQRHPTQAKI